MHFRQILLLFAFAVPVLAFAGDAKDSKAVKMLPEFNQLVLDVIATYPTDGTHDYWWPKGGEGGPYDGVSSDVYFRGVKVMDGEPRRRTFCCGLTLEVFTKAYGEYLQRHGGEEKSPLTADRWDDFQALWFVKEVNGDGPGAALVQYKLGRNISKAEALPGDFVQIWRRPKKDKKTGSGHSVIFLEWVRDEKRAVTGFKYWSTQEKTKGIHENIEYFAPPEAEDGVADEFTHWSRVEIAAPAPSAAAEKKP